MHFTFYICLFVAIWFATVNALRGIKGQKVPGINFAIMAAAIVGCVYAALECKC
jgi:hypothetical protein